VSVIVLSAAGVAAVTGIIPKSTGAASAVPAPFAPNAAATVAAPGGISLPLEEPKPVAKPRPVVKRAAPAPVTHTEVYQAVPAPIAQARSSEAQARSLDSGTVESVREVSDQGEHTWMGPVAGGVGGAILGSQLGKGNGRTLMTVLGAAGGAYAGREVEKRVRASKHWEVAARLEDGSTRVVRYDTQPAFHPGDRVRWVNGTLQAEQRT
jgi:outer membrane lipoprotein SlyB